MPADTRLAESSRAVFDALHRALAQRILVLDGAMGTMIQRYGLSEEDFRGERCGIIRRTSRATTTS